MKKRTYVQRMAQIARMQSAVNKGWESNRKHWQRSPKIASQVVSITAALVVMLAIANPFGRSMCFNVYYPDTVIAEDSTVIQCPAVYYR